MTIVPIHIQVINTTHANFTKNLLYKTENYISSCFSVCIFGTLITQQCLHQLKWHLLKMKAMSWRITEFIYKPTKPNQSA